MGMVESACGDSHAADDHHDSGYCGDITRDSAENFL